MGSWERSWAARSTRFRPAGKWLVCPRPGPTFFGNPSTWTCWAKQGVALPVPAAAGDGSRLYQPASCAFAHQACGHKLSRGPFHATNILAMALPRAFAWAKVRDGAAIRVDHLAGLVARLI